MILMKQISKDNVAFDVIVNYNYDINCVDEIISVIARDENDGAEIVITNVLYDYFKLDDFIDNIDWHEIYSNFKNERNESEN